MHLVLARGGIHQFVRQHIIQHQESVAQGDEAANIPVQAKGFLQPEGQQAFDVKSKRALAFQGPMTLKASMCGLVQRGWTRGDSLQ
jgi:hypothetical protein